MAKLPIDSGIGINPHIQTAQKTAEKLNVDPKKVDKVMQKMGADVLKELGPSYMAYLRTMAETLFGQYGMCTREFEPDIKSLRYQVDSPHPHVNGAFLSRDTSKAPPYEGKLPENFLNSQTLNLLVQKGWDKNFVNAIKVLFGIDQKPQQEMYYMNTSTEGQQRERGDGGQGGQQGQSQEEDEWGNVQFGEEGGPPQSGGQVYAYSYAPGTAPGAPSGGGSLKMGMGGGPGGTPTGGGTLREGMGGGPGGGAPGGFGPPPPPPPPGMGMGVPGGQGQTPYQEYMDQLPGQMQTENQYLNANFNAGDPYYGWFQSVFGSENWYRNFAAKGLTELQAIRGAKQQIMAQLAGINPSSPEGAKKLYILQQKLSEIQGNERQIYDHISTAQKANNERKEMIKAIFDMIFQTNSAIIRNIGR